jgi:glycosyltransferase involved in cell wall biosynthesis
VTALTPDPRLFVATILREDGNTGVHTHVRQLRRYLGDSGAELPVITPFSREKALASAVFGARLLIDRCSGPASVAWYRYWHEIFLRRALRQVLADGRRCVIYAQEPLAARAALRARTGPHQRVVMAVHFRTSQADEWAGKQRIGRDGRLFRGIRRFERNVIPHVDGLVYVSQWARGALLEWLPEAAEVPDAVIGNFVTPWPASAAGDFAADLVTTGHLEPVKNHRYLLEVLGEARRAGHQLTLDVFGEGPLLHELQRQARSLGVADQVRFRGFRRDIRDFLPRYRAYVHASYSESSSLAIMEAMAAGLPVVAGDIGPISELCDDGAEARFWPLDDAGHAARTLLGLLDDEAARTLAARAALARFRRDFDAGTVAPRLVSFLLDGTSRELDAAPSGT